MANRTRANLLLLAMVLGVGAVVGGALLHKRDAPYAACREAIRRRLVSPATAKFPPFRDVRVDDEIGLHETDIYGYVDSQNSFGALLRTHWRCTLGPGGYVKDVQVDGANS